MEMFGIEFKLIFSSGLSPEDFLAAEDIKLNKTQRGKLRKAYRAWVHANERSAKGQGFDGYRPSQEAPASSPAPKPEKAKGFGTVVEGVTPSPQKPGEDSQLNELAGGLAALKAKIEEAGIELPASNVEAGEPTPQTGECTPQDNGPLPEAHKAETPKAVNQEQEKEKRETMTMTTTTTTTTTTPPTSGQIGGLGFVEDQDLEIMEEEDYFQFLKQAIISQMKPQIEAFVADEVATRKAEMEEYLHDYRQRFDNLVGRAIEAANEDIQQMADKAIEDQLSYSLEEAKLEVQREVLAEAEMPGCTTADFQAAKKQLKEQRKAAALAAKAEQEAAKVKADALAKAATAQQLAKAYPSDKAGKVSTQVEAARQVLKGAKGAQSIKDAAGTLSVLVEKLFSLAETNKVKALAEKRRKQVLATLRTAEEVKAEKDALTSKKKQAENLAKLQAELKQVRKAWSQASKADKAQLAARMEEIQAELTAK